MGWSIGFDGSWNRFRGYAVPAKCDHPECNKDIYRGVDSICSECELSFCDSHLFYREIDPPEPNRSSEWVCDRCLNGEEPFDPKPETDEWINWIRDDESWSEWRKEKGVKTAEQIRAVFEVC